MESHGRHLSASNLNPSNWLELFGLVENGLRLRFVVYLPGGLFMAITRRSFETQIWNSIRWIYTEDHWRVTIRSHLLDGQMTHNQKNFK